MDVTGLFVELSSKKRFVHGNLDSRSVFIETVTSNDSEFLRLRVDTSEHHMLTKLLKAVAIEVETQEETTSEEQAKTCAFEEFRRRSGKVCEETDVQALGQLILLLMKHTDFSGVESSLSDKISDLVQNCSFTYKSWQQVLTHSVLCEDFLDKLNQGACVEKQSEEYSALNMVPL